MDTDRKRWSFTITPVRLIFAAIAAAAIIIIIVRFILGLGATTNLNDQWPWGFWISFDVLLGVALAGGGYGVALLVYVLRKDQFYPIARSAMLTSLLGYVIVVMGLIIEVGQPWYAWRPFVSWGYSSILFEVFLCVSLYTIIQVLKFMEVATEKVFTSYHKYLMIAMPVLLIIGITLPTLHQSALGALYYMMVGKLDPLWWSMLLPAFFLMSSFFVGPAMIALESSIAGKALKHEVEIPVLRGLVKIAGGVMIAYLAIKVIDLVIRGQIAKVFAFDFVSIMFLLEIGLGVVIPIFIAFSVVSSTRKGILLFGGLTVAGVIMNRFNVVITGMGEYVNAYGGYYFPAWTEFVVSAGLVAIACLLYLFIAENFSIVDHRGSEPIKGVQIEHGKYAYFK